MSSLFRGAVSLALVPALTLARDRMASTQDDCHVAASAFASLGCSDFVAAMCAGGGTVPSGHAGIGAVPSARSPSPDRISATRSGGAEVVSPRRGGIRPLPWGGVAGEAQDVIYGDDNPDAIFSGAWEDRLEEVGSLDDGPACDLGEDEDRGGECPGMDVADEDHIWGYPDGSDDLIGNDFDDHIIGNSCPDRIHGEADGS